MRESDLHAPPSLATNVRPGTILSLNYLGRAKPIAGMPGAHPIAVFYLVYHSSADGGTKIAAQLYVPLGQPPAEGWPESVWSHGLGDPAQDFRTWPFAGNKWWDTRGRFAGRWAQAGILTLVPWMPGDGPSEPLASYSPLSLARNAQANLDAFQALRNLEHAFAERPELLLASGITPRLDHARQVFRSDCISGPTLIALAARWRQAPALAGLKALVADSFQPSIAYVTSYLAPFARRLAPGDSAAVKCIWALPIWGLAEHQGWPLRTFFSERAIEVLSAPMPTPVGELSRIRGARLWPAAKSELAASVLSAASADLGRIPSGDEIPRWLHSPEYVRWELLPTLKELVNDPWYQTYLAASDPFFEETMTPFAPDIPLLVIGRGGNDLLFEPAGMPSLTERYRNMTLPRIRTLQSWGWDVRVFQDESEDGTSYGGGRAQNWVFEQLASPFERSVPQRSYST